MEEITFDFEGLSVYQKALDFIHRVCYYGSLPIAREQLLSAKASINHSN